VISTAASVLFWLCFGAMLHTYLLYPLTLRFFRRRYVAPAGFKEGAWPTIALLIPAYNEERVIGEKVANALALDYEPGKFEILIGSDGSTDRTNEIVASFNDPRVRLIELAGRSGKSGVLNRLVSETNASILIFSDANVMIETGALQTLVRHFADQSVGVVNGGKYILIPAGAESVRGEAVYGAYENRLRTVESDMGGMSGALGSLMALRRELYRPFAKGAINDDTVPAIWAVLAGLRQVHDPEAKAFEESGMSIREEFRRRVRIGAGNFQTLFRYKEVLQPRYGVVAYTYFSHKVLRWIFPFLMMVTLIANLFLLDRPFYQVLFMGQVIFYFAALLGWLGDLFGARFPMITSVYHFTAMNVALLFGFFVYRKGIQSAAWERTER
jgi:cellulose synthase/poly-beta-1,6-N-acetylglucosamine synthase-like glycosyltransferase